MTDEAIVREVEANYAAFTKKLPRLLATCKGKWAVMHKCEIMMFFDSPGDAYLYGKKHYPDGLFSIQEVTDLPVQIGSLCVTSVRFARDTIARAFREDPNFRRGYTDNVACILMDRLGITDKDVRDPVAEMIVHMLFEENEHDEEVAMPENDGGRVLNGFEREAVDAYHAMVERKKREKADENTRMFNRTLLEFRNRTGREMSELGSILKGDNGWAVVKREGSPDIWFKYDSVLEALRSLVPCPDCSKKSIFYIQEFGDVGRVLLFSGEDCEYCKVPSETPRESPI